jgi:hypothetical protein
VLLALRAHGGVSFWSVFELELIVDCHEKQKQAGLAYSGKAMAFELGTVFKNQPAALGAVQVGLLELPVGDYIWGVRPRSPQLAALLADAETGGKMGPRQPPFLVLGRVVERKIIDDLLSTHQVRPGSCCLRARASVAWLPQLPKSARERCVATHPHERNVLRLRARGWRGGWEGTACALRQPRRARSMRRASLVRMARCPSLAVSWLGLWFCYTRKLR